MMGRCLNKNTRYLIVRSTRTYTMTILVVRKSMIHLLIVSTLLIKIWTKRYRVLLSVRSQGIDRSASLLTGLLAGEAAGQGVGAVEKLSGRKLTDTQRAGVVGGLGAR